MLNFEFQVLKNHSRICRLCLSVMIILEHLVPMHANVTAVRGCFDDGGRLQSARSPEVWLVDAVDVSAPKAVGCRAQCEPSHLNFSHRRRRQQRTAVGVTVVGRGRRRRWFLQVKAAH